MKLSKIVLTFTLLIVSPFVMSQDVPYGYDTLKLIFKPPVQRVEGTPLSLSEIAFYEVEVRDVVSDEESTFLCEAGEGDTELFQDVDGSWYSSCSVVLPEEQFYEVAVGIIDTNGKRGLKYRTSIQFLGASGAIPTDVELVLPESDLAGQVAECQADENCTVTFNSIEP